MRPRPLVLALATTAVVAPVLSLIAWVGKLGSSDLTCYQVRRERFVRMVSAEGNLKAVRSTLVSPQGTSMWGPLKIAWLVDDGSRVKAGDLVARFDPTEMEKSLLDGRADRASAESKISKRAAQGDAALKGSERDAGLARFELEFARQFRRKDEEIFSRVAIIESEIDEKLAAHRLEHAETSRLAQAALARTEIEIFSIERRKAELKIRQARDGLSALEIRAPHDGIVLLRRDYLGNLPKAGDTVWGRQPLAELPALDVMEAEVYVLEADAGGLGVGLPATVDLEAQPGQSYSAKVRRVDKVPKPRLRGLPLQYFALTLALERTDPEVMKPGQRVRASLTVEDKESVLVVPRQAVFEKENRRIVYRRRGKRFETSEVILGAFSLGRVVIEHGVEEGDQVALRDPTRSLEEILETEEKARPSGPEKSATSSSR